MPGARVFSALSGVLFQFQPRCLAGVWTVELRACFSLIRIVKMEICLYLASCCILQESEQGIWKGRSTVGRGIGGRVQGTVFCCLFLQSTLEVHFLLAPLGPEDCELSNTGKHGFSAQCFPILSLAPQKAGIWKSGALALLTKLS